VTEGNIPAELRRERILTLVRDREFVRVGDLSAMFGLSEVTIRSDLDLLAESSGLQRVHGGAIIRDPTPRPERSFEESLGAYADEKEAIGSAAAAMVSSGETIILDVGSTTSAIARALVQRADLYDVVVFTNGISLALELEAAIPRFTVVVTGGTLRPLQHSLVEPMATHILEEVNVSTAFLGCNGVHPAEGVTNVNLPEAALKRLMVDAAQRCVVVADGSKIGNISVIKIADLDAVDVLLTGASAPPEALNGLEREGPTVEIAS
jgi:DeoR family transcriptional regulator of aga operon